MEKCRECHYPLENFDGPSCLCQPVPFDVDPGELGNWYDEEDLNFGYHVEEAPEDTEEDSLVRIRRALSDAHPDLVIVHRVDLSHIIRWTADGRDDYGLQVTWLRLREALDA
jgi:hypothetical protein